MLSLVELERAAVALSDMLVGGRVERWLEPEPGRIVFSIYRHQDSRAGSGSAPENDSPDDPAAANPSRKRIVDLDARPGIAHVALIDRMPAAPPRMPAFCAYLRAHLAHARLEAVFLRSRDSRSGDDRRANEEARDRQLALRFEAKEGRFTLLLCLFGRRSNLYLLDDEDRLIRALRPLSDTRSELAPGEPYVDPTGEPRKDDGDRFEGSSGAVLLEAIGACYGDEIRDDRADRERRELLTVLRKERKNAERRVAKIEAELAEAEGATALAREGELLKANLSRVVPGEDSIRVSDFETGEPVRIRLDPKLSAKQNLQAIFKRYQKLLRRLTKAGGQIEAARENLRSLTDLESEVRDVERGTGGTWDEILARESVRRLLSRHSARSPTRGGAGAVSASRREEVRKRALPAAYRDRPRRLHPRRYRSADGLEIWVGRSDEGNDLLTTRFARGKDLFFHLDGAPGSHVILRTEGREDPPSESVLDACELAVHFSKQKNAGRADVHIVPIKNVKKPKGAKRGLVHVTGGKTVHLRREPARLERLLDSRIDD